MYENLCQLFPEATEADDEFLNRHKLMSGCEGPSEKHMWDILDKTELFYGFRLLNIPMRHMWLDILDEHIKQNPRVLAHNCIVDNHPELLRHLLVTNKVTPQSLEYVYTLDVDEYTNESSMDYAARHGYFDILKVLHDAGCDWISEWGMGNAAENGHLEIVKFLHENRTESCTTEAIDSAARNGHCDIVKWLHENRSEGCTKDAMDDAASRGHLDVVKFLHENRSEECTNHAMNDAAINGHLDVVKFLHENRSEGCTPMASEHAALHRHLDVIKYLIENRNEGSITDAMKKCHWT